MTTEPPLLLAPVALGAAAVCFGIRMVGVHFHLNAPGPPRRGPDRPASGGAEQE